MGNGRERGLRGCETLFRHSIAGVDEAVIAEAAGSVALADGGGGHNDGIDADDLDGLHDGALDDLRHGAVAVDGVGADYLDGLGNGHGGDFIQRRLLLVGRGVRQYVAKGQTGHSGGHGGPEGYAARTPGGDGWSDDSGGCAFGRGDDSLSGGGIGSGGSGEVGLNDVVGGGAELIFERGKCMVRHKRKDVV